MGLLTNWEMEIEPDVAVGAEMKSGKTEKET